MDFTLPFYYNTSITTSDGVRQRCIRCKECDQFSANITIGDTETPPNLLWLVGVCANCRFPTSFKLPYNSYEIKRI